MTKQKSFIYFDKRFWLRQDPKPRWYEIWPCVSVYVFRILCSSSSAEVNRSWEHEREFGRGLHSVSLCLSIFKFSFNFLYRHKEDERYVRINLKHLESENIFLKPSFYFGAKRKSFLDNKSRRQHISNDVIFYWPNTTSFNIFMAIVLSHLPVIDHSNMEKNNFIFLGLW